MPTARIWKRPVEAGDEKARERIGQGGGPVGAVLWHLSGKPPEGWMSLIATRETGATHRPGSRQSG